MSQPYLWGQTHCPGARVKIYIDPELKDAWAETDWKHGVCSIYLHPTVLKTEKRLHEVLVHEFVHAVEYLNDAEYMKVDVVENCTALAQTMEKQLAPLLWNLQKKKGRRRP
jgi:hypothetical protein